MNLAELESLPDPLAVAELGRMSPGPGQHADAAALALRLGVPDVAIAWALLAGEAGAATAAAAALRLGKVGQARAIAATLPPSARRAVLYARAEALGGEPALSWAEQARDQARREGDAPALIAAAILLGELQLSEPFAALRSLAEGLKVAEVVGQEADAHLLAVLAYAQQRVGSSAKAQRTAHKALDRSLPRSPARVWALLVLGQTEAARTELRAGQLSQGWLPRR